MKENSKNNPNENLEKNKSKDLTIHYGIPFSLPRNINFAPKIDDEIDLQEIINFSDIDTLTDKINFTIGEKRDNTTGFIEIGINLPQQIHTQIEVARDGKYYILPNLLLPPEEDDELYQPTAKLFDGVNTFYSNLECLGQSEDGKRNNFSVLIWCQEDNKPVLVGYDQDEFDILKLTLFKSDPRLYPISSNSNFTFE